MEKIALVKEENIQTIVALAPRSYQANRLSCDNCTKAGQALLEEIQAQGGMTDELEQQAAVYIDKARKTVQKMNERRSPVTKLFDEIRRVFTAMENRIDPGMADTIPFTVQQLRNQYAAKKHAEEEERRRREMERQQAEVARAKMKQDIEDDFERQFSNFLNSTINWMTEHDKRVTLGNYDAFLSTIQTFPDRLPDVFLANLCTTIRIPVGIPADEVHEAEKETKQRLEKKIAEMYACEVQDNKNFILDRLPSKKTNLERIARADAEEAARIKADMEERQRREAAQKEEERQHREAEAKAKAELARKQLEMSSLFDMQTLKEDKYQPHVKVTRKIELLNPEGIMPIISMWWSKVGCTLSVGELSKMFKKQITFCEKLANKDDVYIQDESVAYVDDVKAK